VDGQPGDAQPGDAQAASWPPDFPGAERWWTLLAELLRGEGLMDAEATAPLRWVASAGSGPGRRRPARGGLIADALDALEGACPLARGQGWVRLEALAGSAPPELAAMLQLCCAPGPEGQAARDLLVLSGGPLVHELQDPAWRPGDAPSAGSDWTPVPARHLGSAAPAGPTGARRPRPLPRPLRVGGLCEWSLTRLQDELQLHAAPGVRGRGVLVDWCAELASALPPGPVPGDPEERAPGLQGWSAEDWTEQRRVWVRWLSTPQSRGNVAWMVQDAMRFAALWPLSHHAGPHHPGMGRMWQRRWREPGPAVGQAAGEALGLAALRAEVERKLPPGAGRVLDQASERLAAEAWGQQQSALVAGRRWPRALLTWGPAPGPPWPGEARLAWVTVLVGPGQALPGTLGHPVVLGETGPDAGGAASGQVEDTPAKTLPQGQSGRGGVRVEP